LGLALLEDPLEIFTDAYGQPRGTGTKDVDGKTYDTITLAGGDKDGVTTLLVDPATHLLRRIDVDLKSALENRGATDVKHAAMTVNYSEVATDKAAAPDQFAWAPPEGAREVPAAPPAGAEGEPGQGAMALVGKPAPAFTLKDLDGKDVALAEQKGSVVLLDFWATWCGPCVVAMPGIDKLNNELGPKGLKVFAVNVGEDKDTAQGFMTAKGFKIPTLLDADSKVSEQYKAMAIPQTVVIGKDGVVTKVFVGSGGDTEHKIREAVEAAMKG
jgi:peroxiredoxin